MGGRHAMPRVNAFQLALGAAFLLVGAAVYSFARRAQIDGLPQALHFPGALRLPVLLAGSLPTFAHTAAFSLMTAAVLGSRRYAAWRVCAIWVGVNAGFELGQHPSLRPWLNGALVDAPWPFDSLRGYFARGTFDVADLGAAALGGLAAWVVLSYTRDREDRT
jgi:hypothetical protein